MEGSIYTYANASTNVDRLNEVISVPIITLVRNAIDGSMQDAFITEVNKAVEAKVKVIEGTLKKKLDRAIRLAELRADIKAACFLIKKFNTIH